ncbi:DUF547 domain-containing protein, partial [Chitinophagales bacterium]|nr:DUF547 domain-containing protein [Chitinophagales bacterium]
SGLTYSEVALKLFTAVKQIKGESVNLNLIQGENSQPVSHEGWSDLLEQHVREEGKVSYRGFIQDSLKLNNYLSLLSSQPPAENWSEKEQIAYWINAYNAFTVKLIVDNYPLKSIKELGEGLPMINSPWDIKFFKIADEPFDLNTIEHEILRKQFEEPRIHFAINCASVSCPVLRNEAYDANSLEQQLEEQTIAFLYDPSKNLITGKETQLSKIFDWFKSDFTNRGELVSFLKRYRPELDVNTTVEYLPYDWALNE